MKRFLSVGSFAFSVFAIACAANGNPVSSGSRFLPQSGERKSIVVSESVISRNKLAQQVSLEVIKGRDGIVKKRIVSPFLSSDRIALLTMPVKHNSEAANGVLAEGFEGFDGSSGWLPEGWTLKRDTDPAILAGDDAPLPWYVSESSIYVQCPEGKNYIGVNYSTHNIDEWLVFPSIEVKEGYQLSFWTLNDAAFLFDLSNVDWDNMEFLGDRVCSVNVRIMASEDGGKSWCVVKDYFEANKDRPLSDMLMEQGLWYEDSVNLDRFAGKTVTLAFQYVGKDGNTVMLDGIKVGYPELNPKYSEPLHTQFFGMTKDWLTFGSLSVGVLPVYSPVTWTNESYIEGAEYSWYYHAPDDDMLTLEGAEELTLTYHPCYTNEFTTRNNVYHYPELRAVAPMSSPGAYNNAHDYFQAGGRPDWVFSDGDGSVAELGLLPFSPNVEGMDITVAGDYDDAVPVFGHNANSNKYWSLYTFGDESEINESNYSHLTHVMNAYFTDVAPIVINGVRVLAMGKISPDVEFTVDIVPLNEDGTLSSPIASATIKGSDVLVEEYGSNDLLQLPFVFEKPIALSSEDCAVYTVRLTGFNDDRIKYFAPYNSVYNSSLGVCHGFIQKEIAFEGTVRTDALSALVSYTERYNAFAFVLDAWYPWLETESEDTVSLTSGNEVSIALDSFYDGSEIAVENKPEWLNASVEGQYGDAKLVLSSDAENNGTAVISLTAPGVRRDFKVLYETSGINGIEESESPIMEYYDLQGRKCDVSERGVYIGRRADGSTVKIVK